MDSIKVKFGRRFKEARLKKGLSRQVLGDTLGVNVKTIQSWELGRTFIQELDLLPAIEVALGFSVGRALAEIVEGGGVGGRDNALPLLYAC